MTTAEQLSTQCEISEQLAKDVRKAAEKEYRNQAPKKDNFYVNLLITRLRRLTPRKRLDNRRKFELAG